MAAFAFWYLVTLFYLWTHEWIEGDGPRALIFPPLLPEVEEAMRGARKPQLAEWLESAALWPLTFTHIGYAQDSNGSLWELHFLATVSLIAFVLLYLFLYPIVAPVVTTSSWRRRSSSPRRSAAAFCAARGGREAVGRCRRRAFSSLCCSWRCWGPLCICWSATISIRT